MIVKSRSSLGILPILDLQDGLREYAGPGHWNDPDMMEVGNRMSVNQDRAHFSMWAMLAAPLIAGNDLRDMSPETLAILINKEVIAIDQDPLGIQAMKYLDYGDLEIWFKPLEGGDWAMTILNRGRQDDRVVFDWAAEHVNDDLTGHRARFPSVRYRVRDLWSGEELGTTEAPHTFEVPGQDVRVVRLTRIGGAAAD